jgi:ligand-binding SRPBCC domain-containing protein
MPTITLHTTIHAPIEICFDLARSIDFHQFTTFDTKEKAIAGKTSGLIAMNETVTWEAVHFGVKQKLTSKITGFDKPFYFKDEQVKGAFKCFYHEHIFEFTNGVTSMKDTFVFESPFGLLGKLFNALVLTAYMRKFLMQRNRLIKEYAENGKWKNFIPE